MNASQLRATTIGHVLACSPVQFVDEHGRHVEHIVTTAAATDKDGKKVPAAASVLTLVIRQVTTDPVTAVEAA